MNPNITVTACSPGSPSSTTYTIHVSDSEDVGKRRRKRTIITTEQLTKLEGLYSQEQWPNRERKEKLAREIGMSTHFVNIWFQNKRSRMKKMAQEEAELASLRKSMSESESQKSQESDTEPSTSSMSLMKSSRNETLTGQTLVASPSRAKPKPIRPSPVMPAQSNFKTVLSDLKLTSPQVVCVKIPFTSRSAASSTDQSTVTKKIKLEAKTEPLQALAGMTMKFPASPVLKNTNPAKYQDQVQDIVNMAIASELLQEESQTQPQSDELVQTSSADTFQQIFRAQGLATSHNQMLTEQQQTAHKPPQVRFAYSSSAQMQPRNALQSGLGKKEVIENHLAPSQESNHISYVTQSPTSSTSHDMNQPINSLAATSQDTYQSSPTMPSYNLFDCLVAMAAIEEGGGIVQREDPIYDVAVNSALYGIKVDEDVVLTHDKEKGLRFTQMEG